jgi:hypothetical protein
VIHDGQVERETALVRMQEAAALWSVGQVTAAGLVTLACELLVVGFGGMNLAVLAGVHARNADEEVPDLLEAAPDDVGLSHYPAGSDAGLEATVRIMASHVLAGLMSPMDLATWVHSTMGHDRLPITEHLVDLDDMYDILDYTDMTEEDLDNEISRKPGGSLQLPETAVAPSARPRAPDAPASRPCGEHGLVDLVALMLRSDRTLQEATYARIAGRPALSPEVALRWVSNGPTATHFGRILAGLAW